MSFLTQGEKQRNDIVVGLFATAGRLLNRRDRLIRFRNSHEAATKKAGIAVKAIPASKLDNRLINNA